MRKVKDDFWFVPRPIDNEGRTHQHFLRKPVDKSKLKEPLGLHQTESVVEPGRIRFNPP